MDRARSAVTNFIGRYPLSYTRFSLTPQTDGDASQVEMKLADDEECGDQTMGEPVVKQRPENNCKRICMKILLGAFLILLGFLIGYLSHRGRDSSMQSKNPETVTCSAVNDCNAMPPNDEDETNMETEMPSVLHWSDLAPILKFKIDNLFMENNIEKISKISREAGTRNEESAALMVHEEFGQMSLDKVWNDEHYVKLQEPGSSLNKVTILSNKAETLQPSAYVAYSPAANVNGKLVYCHYGREEDFKAIQEKKIDLSENLILVRSGLISFAEKVKNAELNRAKGVLIYPEPSDLTFPLHQSGSVDSPFGHAHYGTGDPYTPGFPSFNHTQFPPSKSSGLPSIPVQTISSEDGKKLLAKLDGDNCPETWQVGCKLGPQLKDVQNIKLEVTNVLVEKKIYNVFGVIQGFEQSDHYVVVGAQRDSWGPGVSKAAVGTSLLLELARMLSDMVKTDGFRPRRSIVFASWGAGDFGSVGATEWLEGYLNNLHLKAFSYINLDSAVQGSGTFQVSASPLLNKVILQTLKEVADPVNTDFTLYRQLGSQAWTNKIVPFSIEDSAYPFLTYSGIPSVSFSFQEDNKPYAYLGTKMDTLENFNRLVDLNRMCRTAAHFAAQIIMRLTHEQKLPLDYSSYSDVLLKVTSGLQQQFRTIKELNLTLTWVNSARGDFSRAAASLTKEFAHSDLENTLILRSLNDRIMKVERGMLSPYVSPKDTPFRHIIYGSGNHTVAALMDHLNLLNTNKAAFDADLFKNQLAMLTWTMQGAANSLAGNIWDIDNSF